MTTLTPNVSQRHLAIYLAAYEEQFRMRHPETPDDLVEAVLNAVELELVHGRVDMSGYHLAACLRLALRPANPMGINAFIRTPPEAQQ